MDLDAVRAFVAVADTGQFQEAASPPAYPHSLIWRRDNPHPALTALRDHLDSGRSDRREVWTPEWAPGARS